MTTIFVYNTLTRSVEPIVTAIPNTVRMFVCGPTVYDFAHLGHAKTYTQFDFIARYLRFRGYQVTYLQNITDVDDKIIRRAAERGIPSNVLAEEYERYYREDMMALHNTSVDIYARAHDYMDGIVSQVERLIDRGYAYQTSDGYYFDTKCFSDYGKLSRRSEVLPEDAVSRIDENPEKHNPGDFCLWKLQKPGEPFWETKLGSGRPGWHIEDTAITEHHFGPQYDIHGGAIDLIFPHHEAEIAQMEAASGLKPLVRYWLHTGFLNTKSQKMSKSLGNFVTIRDLLKELNYRVLRFYFLSHHYRNSMELGPEMLEQARSSLERIDIFVGTVRPDVDDVENEEIVREFRDKFFARLDQDFDTPVALSYLYEFIKDQNRRNQPGKRVYELLQNINAIFDFISFEHELLDEEIERQIVLRSELRSQKRFAEADAVRDRLVSQGIILEDGGNGVRWRRRL